MTRHFLFTAWAILCSLVFASAALGDSLTGLSDVTVVDDQIVSFRYDGEEYVVAADDLMLGTTTRWYVPSDTGVETLWAEGDPAPTATVTGTSNPKEGDVGSRADNFSFRVDGSNNMSSIDGIDFQQTIFPVLSNMFFVFERGGNDAGTYQAVYADGTLGPEVPFNGSQVYADTGIGVGGQNAFGVVFETDLPAQGVRITASGHDALSVSIPAGGAVATQAHEPQPEDGAINVATNATLTWKTGVDPADPNVPNPAITGHFLWLSPAYDPQNPPSKSGWWTDPGVQIFPIQGDTNPADGMVDETASYTPGNLQRDKLYYWVVDESLGAANENDADNLIFGNTWQFETETTGPVVDAGSSILSWLKDGTTTIDLDGTVTDATNNVTSIQWTVLASPFGSTVSIANPVTAATSVTLDTTGRYVLELSATDATAKQDSDTMEINVYNDSCEAAKNHPDGYTAPAYDFNGDCIVDFNDFAMFASGWLEDGALAADTPYEPDAIPLPPFVQFTNPTDGMVVSGEIVVNAIAYDPAVGTTDGDGMGDASNPASGVDFEVLDNSGTVIDDHHENIEPYDWTWDTASGMFPNGAYTVRVIATSDAGYSTTTEISVTVNN